MFIIFLGCAVIDFIWGFIGERSVPAGVISVVGGLLGTAWYLLLDNWITLLLTGSQDNENSSLSQR